MFLPCKTPIEAVHYSAGRSGVNRLIVFLPGIGDLAEDFEAAGLICAAMSTELVADAIAVDAHFGYYARRSVVDRLAHDVVLPARRRGYREIWLVGISMGGAGALAYTAHHPAHVERVLLLAPYLGEAKRIQAIIDEPCLQTDKMVARSEVDPMHDVWRWMVRPDAHDVLTKLYLGYGIRDRFATANALLGARLPATHVRSLPGGHDWRTWKRLWDAFVAAWTKECSSEGMPSS